MKKNLIIYLAIFGLIGLLSACKKDETKAIMSASPIAPTLTTVPDLTLQRAKATDMLVFVGTPVNPGFQASATYYLEACVSGNNFTDPVVLLSGVQDTEMKISVSDLNGLLLKKLPADQVSSVDFRIRAVLIVDGGTGAPGTGSNPFVYSSPVKTANVTVFGLPRLDLVGSGVAQNKIESALGDGSYVGFVKLDATKPFTLLDPDANIAYGANGAALAVSGTAIPVTASGWYKLTANTKTLTYKLDPYMVGIIGSATPNSWNSPDTKMNYDAASGTWKVTLDLKPSDDGGVMKCEFKFRLNDGWATNWGGTADNLTFNGPNIVATPGNYTISLKITNDVPGSNTGTYTMVKN